MLSGKPKSAHPVRLALSAAFSIACLACLPARALDVSGYVLDKTFTPIAGAMVCVKSESNRCVSSDLTGLFHITSSLGARRLAPQSAPYGMELRGGMLSLSSPTALRARLDWTGPDGRALAKARTVDLSAGRTAIALPAGLPENGICFIRLNTPDLSLAWKAVLTGSRSGKGSGRAATDGAGRIASLSKAASAGTLEISKLGYRTRIYEPASEPDTSAVIFLSATDDTGLTYSIPINQKITSIDRAAKTLVAQSITPRCDSAGIIVHDTLLDTSSYAFQDGKFWLWTKGDCFGQSFTGTGTAPLGSWTLADGNAELPAALRSGCVPDSTSGGVPYSNYSATYAVTETTATGTITMEFCPADLLGPVITNLFAADTGVTLAKNTCKQVVLNNTAGETGTLDFSKQGDNLHAEFTYKSQTCKTDYNWNFGDADPVCPDTSNIGAWYICIAASGFSANQPLTAFAKTSAPAQSAPPILPMSFEIPTARGTAYGRSLQAAWPVTGKTAKAMAPVSAFSAFPLKGGSIFPQHGRLPAKTR